MFGLSRRLTAAACCLIAGLTAASASAQFGPPQGNQGNPQPGNNPAYGPAAPAPRQYPTTQPTPGMQPGGQPQYPTTVPQPQQRGPAQQVPGPRQQVPLPPKAQAPFQLTQAEFDNLWTVLQAWQQESDKVQRMRCDLTLWEYDEVFNAKTQRNGEMQYAKPDKGLYRMKDAEGKQYVEHWLCDGKSIFEYNHNEQKLIERTLPPELQGNGISNGPMPFLFGANADQMLKRYFLRVVTPENVASTQLWIEAYPRFQQDAANFRRATVILLKGSMQISAIELLSPNGKSKTVHGFSNVVINDRFNFIRGADFEGDLPRGWTRVVNPEGTPGAQPGGIPTAQRIEAPGSASPPR